MEGLFFNVNNGYIEGIVRGYRNGLLTGQNYSNLTQCETIDGKDCHLIFAKMIAEVYQISSSSLAQRTATSLHHFRQILRHLLSLRGLPISSSQSFDTYERMQSGRWRSLWTT
jgi:hypothetical protein